MNTVCQLGHKIDKYQLTSFKDSHFANRNCRGIVDDGDIQCSLFFVMESKSIEIHKLVLYTLHHRAFPNWLSNRKCTLFCCFACFFTVFYCSIMRINKLWIKPYRSDKYSIKLVNSNLQVFTSGVRSSFWPVHTIEIVSWHYFIHNLLSTKLVKKPGHYPLLS